jgi:hypothetical protein
MSAGTAQSFGPAGSESFCDKEYLKVATSTGGDGPTYSEYVGCAMDIWNSCLEAAKNDVENAYMQCQDMGKEKRGGETHLSVLSAGMYAPQIDRFTKSFARHQIMVVQMEELVGKTADYLTAIYKFMGFQKEVAAALPVSNAQLYPFTVREVDCPTKNKLKALYDPWNAKLYASIKKDQTANKAPTAEPAFPEWDVVKSVKCTPDELKRPHYHGNGEAKAALQPKL